MHMFFRIIMLIIIVWCALSLCAGCVMGAWFLRKFFNSPKTSTDAKNPEIGT